MTLPDPIIDTLRQVPGRVLDPSSDFDLNPDIKLPEGQVLRPAGVLIAVEINAQGPQVYLTKRSSKLKHHPGQIAFPGGKMDDIDTDITAAALREADEEIGLPPAHVEVLGTLAPHETVTGFAATPVLGLIHTPFTPNPELGEVEEVFTVPLAHLLDLSNYRIEGRRWRGSTRHYYVAPYGPYYIWGATARMLRDLARRYAA
jgi:8-oxo-dGTP pyrophosphatase MutT (NUDIX family)